MRLIVNRLRRDLDLVQGQLLKFDGWGDNFVKTRQISCGDARVFDRQFLSQPELKREGLEYHEFGHPQFESSMDSGVRRRYG